MKPSEFVDDRPTQGSLPIEPDVSPKETRLDEGASDEFVDDRETFGTPNTGKQSTIAAEQLDDDGQGDLFGEKAAIEPEWSE